MKLETAHRRHAKIKMSLQGPSGSGKTMSSLLIAYGISKNWPKVAVIDTEYHSADLYAHLGDYMVLSLNSPFTPERYVEAIEACEKVGIDVIIIDSITHEWENLLEYHTTQPGNTFTNWGKVTPRHNAFVQRILNSPCHIIATVRTKQDYVLSDRNGKMVPEKVGLKSIQRDGIEYEFTLVFNLDTRNQAIATKDRTGLFFGKAERRITIETGNIIADWCNHGQEITQEVIRQRIGQASSIKDLLALYNQFPQHQELLKPEFEQRKKQLNPENQSLNLINNPKTNSNGRAN